MNIIQAAILGIVEGITEFLPISSTAHLIFTSRLLGVAQSDFVKIFEVVIQSGAILAVLLMYVRMLLENRNLVKLVLVSFVPTALVGLTLHSVIKDVFFESMPLITFALFFVGLLFLLVEQMVKKEKVPVTKTLEKMTVKDAVLIGVGQSLAVVPGVSRAGIVILAMLGLRYRRDEAALYSFFLAIPTILAASALDLVKGREVLLGAGDNLMLLGIGFATAFVTAYFSVKWLVSYLKTHTLTAFGVYRIILALLLFSTLL